MKNPCTDWEALVAETADRVARDRHLAACATCREQWRAHQALTSLAALPAPPLSPDLAHRVRRAAANLAPESMLSANRRLVMRLYWLLSTFGAGVILAQLGPASTGWLVACLAFGALAAAALPIYLALQRRLSWGLVDLVVWTFR